MVRPKASLRSSLFALGKPQQPPPCLLSAGNISGRSSPPSTSARLPLRSGGITSRFAVGRASGRDDQRFPPLHRPIERLGKRPPRLAGEPCPAPLLSGLSGAEGGGCPPPQGLLGFGGGGDVPPPPRVRGLLSGGRGLGSGSGSGFGRRGGRSPREGGQGPPPRPLEIPPPPRPPLVRSLKVPSGARSAVASSPVGTGLANSGRRVERLPLKVGMTLLQSLKCVVRAAPPIWSPLLSGTPDQEAKPTATSSQR